MKDKFMKMRLTHSCVFYRSRIFHCHDLRDCFIMAQNHFLFLVFCTAVHFFVGYEKYRINTEYMFAVSKINNMWNFFILLQEE